jgi:tryptophanyl-tRNA synthetase
VRIFSGIQPTGSLHIGNYSGAISQWLSLQKDEKNSGFFCIVDLHALTSNPEPEKLRQDVLETAAAYMAFGIGNDRFPVFIQSHVPTHTELAWIFDTMATLGELERMTQFKDKSGSGKFGTIKSGLLMYPVLMAADILLYSTDTVPVGEDQKQHVELARDLAGKFNKRYGHTFIEPKARLLEGLGRIMSIQDPEKKMSKSLGSAHVLGIFEPEADLRKKIKRAVTDSGTGVTIDYDRKKNPAISNLLDILSVTVGLPITDLKLELKGASYAAVKDRIAEDFLRIFGPVREERQELLGDPRRIWETLQSGAERARAIANPKIQEVREKIGLI